MLFARFTERPKPVVDVVPDRRVFRGETVTLTCDIQQTGDWRYSWNKDYTHVYSGQKYIISSVDPSHGGVYSCRGTQSQAPTYSQTSDGVTLTVSGECFLAFRRAVVKSTFVESKTSPSPKRFESKTSPSPKRFESKSKSKSK